MIVNQVAPINALHGKVSPGLKKVAPENWGDKDQEDLGPDWTILYGEWRCGKTNCYLDLIQTAHMINPETRAFVISTDLAVKRNIQEFPYLSAVGCVTVKSCTTADEVMDATSLLGSGFLTRNDWVIVDLASRVWDWMPDYFARKALKKPGGSDQIEQERADDESVKNKGNAMISYYKDGINPMFRKWEERVRTLGANVIMVCGENEVAEEEIRNVRKKDKNQVIRQFIKVGKLPRMQKEVPFDYHSIFYVSRPYADRFFVQTVGERGRKWLLEKRELNPKDPKTGIRSQVGFGDIYLKELCGLTETEDYT
jgi:hypothetical protein